ncbi:hypothetical protein HAX54_029232 [Datura stramonium]|uniref:phosphoribosylaminoimidazole carboxylase n=1 Tax=Datura stramonium TaxID=4076 RepID=A0ABS8SA37_DATST|nr:hypothetical protein [Datura stramonium]
MLGGFDRGLCVDGTFVKELSVIVARGRDGSIACYPAVETIHRDNICHIVKSPANVSWKIMKLATDVAHRAVSSLEGAGVFAVELFLTEDGQILLNEVAPRPHNSGHHTIEACFTSQLKQHLRASCITYWEKTMENPGFLLANQLIGRALGIPGASIHWYDKPEMRRQRKMGHITIVGPSMGVVEAQLRVMLNEDSVNGQPEVAPRVGIIMGSDSDLPVMKDAAKILKEFDVPAEVFTINYCTPFAISFGGLPTIYTVPEMMFSYALSARERGIQVIIAGAGAAPCLVGMVAALTPLPVIGVPVRASTLDGLDSLLSIVQDDGPSIKRTEDEVLVKGRD